MSATVKDDYIPELKNYMEICVKDMLPSVLESTGTCTCPYCQSDVAAIALNSLPPKYVVTRKGQVYTKLAWLHRQFDVDVVAAITKAIAVVGANPRHDHQ